MPKSVSSKKQQSFAIAILAAGKGTRLKSRLPKVLHAIGGKPLLAHVVAAAAQVVPAQNIFAIIGHEADKVRGRWSRRASASSCNASSAAPATP